MVNDVEGERPRPVDGPGVTRYRIVHRTVYRYQSPVSSSYGEAHLLPRDTAGQRVLSGALELDPAPDELRSRLDYFGNCAATFAVHRSHRSLAVTATSEVERVSAVSTLPSGPPWETVRDAAEGARAGRFDGSRTGVAEHPALIEALEFVLPSPHVNLDEHSAAAPLHAELAAFAGASFPAGTPLGTCVLDLACRIHDEFAYRPGAISVQTPLADVLARRTGVCQDFAHVGVGCLRALRLPARYVSGYLETEPPPGQPRLTGADVSHAWFSAFIPGSGWFDVDPTNRQAVGGRHIVTAWGRDYSDVPPLKGVIFTEAVGSEMTVSVDVVRV